MLISMWSANGDSVYDLYGLTGGIQKRGPHGVIHGGGGEAHLPVEQIQTNIYSSGF